VTKGRIVIIDDSDAVLNAARTRLSAAGYEVVATSQTVGVGRHLRGAEIVIIDYHMPGLDGGEVLASLKAASQSAKVPPVFYLYTSDSELEKKSRALGFDGVFNRKGDFEALAQQVDAACRLLKLRALKGS
jgi:two-component system, OmpR family, response regulator